MQLNPITVEMKGQYLSEESRIRVVVLHEEGYSSPKIAKRVGCNQSTVIRIIKKHQETGSTADRHRTGRPKKTTQRQDRVLLRTSLVNRKLTSPLLLREWQEKCSVDVCPSTVRRRCLEFGLRGCKARKKPLLTEQQRKKRLLWAKEYSKWSKEEWEKVLFSDESTFCILGNQANTYVRRFPYEEYKPECLNLSVKCPTKVMIWGCMAASGVGRLKIVEGMVNATKYIEILQQSMLPSAERLFASDFFFQDDNAPCHRAKIVASWIKKKRIKTIYWPAQSPDLNPIENLWHKISLEISKKQPRSKRELIEALIAAWNHIITPEHLRKLVHSMPERCRLVRMNKGWPIKY
jgi:transposase